MAGVRRLSEPPAAVAAARRVPAPASRVRVVLAWGAPAVAVAAIGATVFGRGVSLPHAPAPSEPLAQPGPPETARAAPSMAPAVVLSPLPAPSAPAPSVPSSARAPETKPATRAPATRSSSSADPLGVPGGILFDTRR
jgi:hypothetical protein